MSAILHSLSDGLVICKSRIPRTQHLLLPSSNPDRSEPTTDDVDSDRGKPESHSSSSSEVFRFSTGDFRRGGKNMPLFKVKKQHILDILTA